MDGERREGARKDPPKGERARKAKKWRADGANYVESLKRRGILTLGRTHGSAQGR